MNDVREALRYVPAYDRDLWIRIAMAIKSEMGDSGFSIWDDWSRSADNYNSTDARDVWRSIKPGPVGLGTLFYHARQHGYRSSRKPPERPVRQQRVSDSPRRDTRAYAAEIWLRADCSDQAVITHPYAIDKGIESAGGAGRATVSGRVVGRDADCLVIPIRALQTNKLAGVQCVNPAGEKQSFGSVAGNALLLGNSLDKRLEWFVAEGWASAYSMVFHHYDGNACCAAAFGKGNLEPVALKVAEVYEPERICILREADA